MGVAREDEVGQRLLGAAQRVHRALGPGLLESAHETCLGYELDKIGLRVARQLPLPVFYDGHRLDAGFRLDLVVAECVIVEIKSVERILPVHQAQLLTYLRLSGLKAGYLLNCNVPLLRHGIRRLVNGL